jgi:hypothetical protein
MQDNHASYEKALKNEHSYRIHSFTNFKLEYTIMCKLQRRDMNRQQSACDAFSLPCLEVEAIIFLRFKRHGRLKSLIGKLEFQKDQAAD